MPRRSRFRRLVLLFAALFLGLGGFAIYAVATAPQEPAVSRHIDATARDISPAFAPFGNAEGLDAPAIDAAFAGVAARLDGTRLVIVPSYLADGLLLTNRLGLTDYFASQIAALRAAGFDVALALVDTEASVAVNATMLARLVAADDRPVCFISHSKGGLDVLQFLIDADAATRARVACWVALQAPFHGSPIADLAGGSKALRSLTDPLAEWLGGSGQSLTDLTIAVRAPWMADHDGSVRALVAQTPLLCVATRIDTPSLTLPTIYMRPAFDWMQARNIPNDGLVPVPSAVLPGARYVVLAGLDHADTVADNPVIDDAGDRLLLLKALLALALDAR